MSWLVGWLVASCYWDLDIISCEFALLRVGKVLPANTDVDEVLSLVTFDIQCTSTMIDSSDFNMYFE